MAKRAKNNSKKIRFKIEMMTPERAQKLLDTREKYRNIGSDRVGMYASDIDNGRWHLNCAPIKISEEGKLLDGQHRLAAVVKTGKSVKMAVIYNVPTDEGLDTGRPRSLSTVLGVPVVNVAVARRMMLAGKTSHMSLSYDEVIAFYKGHREAIEFVVDNFPQKNTMRGIRIGPILGAIARAYYTETHKILRDFMRVLATGLANGEEDVSAILLRDWLTKTARESGSRSFRLQAYRKTEQAINRFVGRVPIKRLREEHEELYPIPDEFDLEC